MFGALLRLYDILRSTGKIQPEGWCEEKVYYRLILDQNGNLLSIEDAKEEKETSKGKVYFKAPMVSVPQRVKRSNQIIPNAFCDAPSYFLGVLNPKQKEYGMKRFAASREFHQKLLSNVDTAPAQAVCHFFQKWNPEEAWHNPLVEPLLDAIAVSGNFLLNVEGEDISTEPSCVKAWNAYISAFNQKEDDKAEYGIDSATGEYGKLARLVPGVKGVKGGQPSGVSLVSFNKTAFEHYGKKKSYNASIGAESAKKIGIALQYLVNHPEHCVYIGDTLILFWAENQNPDYTVVFQVLVSGQKEDVDDELVRKYVQDISELEIPEVDLRHTENAANPFYVLGITPNAGRAAIKFFYNTTFGEEAQKIMNHQKRMLLYRSWEPYGFISIWSLLRAGCREGELNPVMTSVWSDQLSYSILNDQRYPQTLLQKMVFRVKAEKGKVTHIRAAAIKAVLMKNYEKRWGGLTMKVNKECEDMPYILGRLFSVLEHLQDTYAREKGRTIGTGLSEKYFKSVCANPAVNLPVVLKISQTYLDAVSVKNKTYFGKQIGEILGLISMPVNGKNPIPKVLSLEEQGAFILGYYQQKQERYTKKENSEERA